MAECNCEENEIENGMIRLFDCIQEVSFIFAEGRTWQQRGER